MSARELLDKLDATWYSKMNPRRMDLLGDYVGRELFLIDGDSIIQEALNDPLLALGRTDDLSFQLIHAIWSVEKLVSEFVKRQCNFEVVFFEQNQYLTVYGGEDASAFVVLSRRLARAMLKDHIERLNITVTTFEAPRGDEWKEFRASKQPMCVLCNDGSQYATGDTHERAVNATLLQRTYIFHMLATGIAVVSLEATDYRGSKMVSFVYEQSVLLAMQDDLVSLIIHCLQEAKGNLPPPEPHTLPPVDEVVEPWVITTTTAFLESNLPDQVDDTIFTMFLLHIALLPSIPIIYRCQKPVILHPNLEKRLRRRSLPKIFDAMRRAYRAGFTHNRPDIDGRIFLNLLLLFTSDSTRNTDLPSLFGQGAMEHIEALMAILRGREDSARLSLSIEAMFDTLAGWQCSTTDPTPPPQEDKVTFSLLPFHNEVFEKCLKPIHLSSEDSHQPVGNSVSTDYSSTESSFAAGNSETLSQRSGWFTNTTTFTDDQHWHNTKKLAEGFREKRLVLYGEKRGDDRPSTREHLAWLKKKRERGFQRLLRDIHRHATTLTGAKGAPLQRLLIPPTKRMVKDLVRPDKPSKLITPPALDQASTRPRKEPKSQEPKLSSADKLRQRIKEEKTVKKLSESELWWKKQLAEIEKLSTLDPKFDHLARVRRNTKRMEDPWLNVETLLYQVHLIVSRWIYEDKGDDPEVQARCCMEIVRVATEIETIGMISDTARSFVLSVLDTVGLSDLGILKSISVKATEMPKKPLTFQPVRFAHRDRSKPPLYPFLRVPTHPIEFQLEHYGVYMDRSMDSQPDPRVSFVPDAWQRNVLDRLDRRESVLVVAPTSAGKTFVSYYAMEQVLRESDDGVLVYVAPTKALVNQIVAEISARFEKSVKSGTIWASHTRDDRIYEPHKCQILVTVPEMLAIMLLSPVLATKWIPRIRWIVLDEIHCIGLQEGGAVWEQLLLFAPCPIIGLSATIGNPEEFSIWLQSIQEQHGFKYALIQHKHRYSHLRKLTYTMTAKPIEFKGLSADPPSTTQLIHIHPMSVLASGPRILPEDLALESRDCLSLFKTMWQASESSPSKRSQLAKLDPQSFFAHSKGRLLTQKDVLGYEADLKSLIADWSKNSDTLDILHSIGTALSEGHDLCEKAASRRKMRFNLIHVLHDLQRRNNLPAILFNFDRHECEEMAEHLLEELKSAETKWKTSSPQWQAKVAKWEAWVAGSKLRQRAANRAKKAKGSDNETPAENKSWEESFDPEEPLPEFSFAGPWTHYSKAELEEDIAELVKWEKVDGWLIEALRVGIAVHHRGMNRKYRSLIESLFRTGFVRVVIATSTLALGINMPVKTSIFVGDSVYLTALTYRQCAGRAGRRGMDLLGNVVFYGMSMERIHRLMTSRVPPLTGNMPLTTTLSLRLCNLLHGSQHAPSAINAIDSVLGLHQLSLASETSRDEVLHHLRFSIDYLRRANLVSATGEPLIMYPLAAHLYHTEPSNLALIALLQGGVLHRICETIDTDPIGTQRSLVAVLSHLFARRILPRLYSGEGALERLRPPKSPSRVILPPLSPDAYRTLLEHSNLILETFRTYALTYAKQYLSRSPDNTLPLSKEVLPLVTEEESPFASMLSRRCIKTDAVSNFVANSGHSDTSLRTVTDLARTTRDGLHLDKNAIPDMDSLLGFDGRVINGYILDFFVHGQETPLIEANRVRRNDIWFALKDFSLALATLQTGLEHYMKAAPLNSDVDDVDSESSDNEDWSIGPEGDTKPEELEAGVTMTFPVKPAGITEGDWRVYRAVVLTKREFDEKFRAIWA